MLEIARLTVKALGLPFVSVDIEIEDEPNDKKRFRVMEVNSGIMMN